MRTYARRNRPTLLIGALVSALVAVGCASEPTIEIEEATALIKAQFPDSEVSVASVRVEVDGTGVAVTDFNDNVVSFQFQAGDDGWVLNAVDFDGSLYFIKDLEQISTTMGLMANLAEALERYRATAGEYPQGEGVEPLLALVPEFVEAEVEFGDAWQRALSYESDGDDYTLISEGPDRLAGSDDDIVIYSGAFVGASEREVQS